MQADTNRLLTSRPNFSRGSYLPFALCLFSWALSSGHGHGHGGWGLGVIMGDALGLVAGHWWYFWTEIWKRERGSGGRNWLETPRIL